MTIVGKLKIFPHVERFHTTDVEKSEILHTWHVCGVENVAIYAKFMQFLFTLFCREIYFAQFMRFHVEKN